MTWDEIKKEKDVQDYIKFLKRTQEVYYTGDFPWVKYQGFLRPAIVLPYEPPLFSPEELKSLLHQTGVPFLRWWENFTEQPTEWWWVVKRSPVAISEVSKKTRNEIRRGLERCVVKKITATFLKENGYDCYYSAHRRYRYARPVDRKTFSFSLSQKEEYPIFEFWGVFPSLSNNLQRLIGYCECLILANTVTTTVIKYHPH